MIKGALHIHSNISPDSNIPREALRGYFKKAGYQFVLVSEHSEDLNDVKYETIKKEYAALSDGSFLMIPGIEIKWKDSVHFLAYGADKYMANENSLPINETIKRIRDKTGCGFLVWGHYNHPKPIPLDWLQYINCVDAVEIFNAAYHGLAAASHEGMEAANSKRKEGRGLVVTGGLDLHRINGYKGIVCEIKDLDRINRDDIFRSLKGGSFISKSIFYTLRQPSNYYGKIELLISRIIGALVNILRKIRMKLSRIKEKEA